MLPPILFAKFKRTVPAAGQQHLREAVRPKPDSYILYIIRCKESEKRVFSLLFLGSSVLYGIDDGSQHRLGHLKGAHRAVIVGKLNHLFHDIDMEHAAHVDDVFPAHAQMILVGRHSLFYGLFHLGEAERYHEMSAGEQIDMSVMVVGLEIHDILKVDSEQFSINAETQINSHSMWFCCAQCSLSGADVGYGCGHYTKRAWKQTELSLYTLRLSHCPYR